MDKNARARFFALVATVLSVDLGTKAWALRALAVPRSLIEGRLHFILARNPHGAMGFLRQTSFEVRRVLLVSLAVVASVVVVTIAKRTRPHQRTLRTGLALVLGGALGNLVDRVAFGSVVDFVDVVYAAGRHWPTFNVADIAIVVGAGLIATGSRARALSYR